MGALLSVFALYKYFVAFSASLRCARFGVQGEKVDVAFIDSAAVSSTVASTFKEIPIQIQIGQKLSFSLENYFALTEKYIKSTRQRKYFAIKDLPCHSNIVKCAKLTFVL